MASSILVLSWSALFNITQQRFANVPLYAISVLGAMISIIWIVIVRRATQYYDIYERDGVRLEELMRNPTEWPFHRRAEYRAGRKNLLFQLRFTHLSQLVPAGFLLFFLLSIITLIFRSVCS
jgi:hypothetical protein